MKISKVLTTLAIAALGSIAVVNANAASCMLPDGKSMSGTYVPTSMLSDVPSRSSTLVILEQKDCELKIKSSIIESYINYTSDGKLKPVTRRTSGGVWKLDLTGQKPAVIPKEYIRANSNEPESIAMTKSLAVYSTLQPDGKLALKILFDFAHAGTVVRMSAETSLEFMFSENWSYGSRPEKYTGMLRMSSYPGIKFRVVPSNELAERSGARNLVISSGVNWLLEALEPQINSMIHSNDLSFMRR
ncbi:hypothetical protein BH10BDE1_BH10BDE1_20320 [soil metagenome]